MSRSYRSGELVDHGSGATLDNLGQVSGGFSWWSWIYRAADAANQHFLTKQNAVTRGWLALISNSPSNGICRFIVSRDTGANFADAVSSTVVSPLYTDAFVAGCFDSAASPAIKLFYGSKTAEVVEVSYNTQTSGSGTPDADSADSLYAGNLQRATTTNFRGSQQLGGIISGDFLTADEFETIRKATRTAVVTNPTLSNVAALFSHVLLFNYAGADVSDLSGNSNNGSVTGALTGPDFPVGNTTVIAGAGLGLVAGL